ncbi:hypothetical protein [Robiginitalea sp. SC105]|uniref:hypothetical protein n=1 Tax=Robiginitalea sp. SC105 TaxID=2762332 RepID=UPI00163B336E|nr:hypothetical protein [Robiginitalea sp. SC105]MBC2840110.1 hypothetical protein [Robiginitalea sp. SC105]
MVTIKGFKTVQKDDGETFNVLLVQGKTEAVKSQLTGKIYVTARVARVPTTLDAEACEKLIGVELEGSVERIPCEPYDYTSEQTGEMLRLSHRWEYVNPNLLAAGSKQKVPDMLAV